VIRPPSAAGSAVSVGGQSSGPGGDLPPEGGSRHEPDRPPEYTDAVHTAGRALEAAGYQVVEATPPDLETVNLAWIALLQLGFADEMAILREVLTPQLVDQVEAMMALPTMSPSAAFLERHRLQRQWTAFFADHSVIVGPVWAHALCPHHADLDAAAECQTLLACVQFITPGNLLGIPAWVSAVERAERGPLNVCASECPDELVRDRSDR